MNKLIYKSEFNAGTEATDKQQHLFRADAEYAFGEGYKHVKSADEIIFTELPPFGMLRVPYTEEQILADAAEEENEDLESEETSDEEYCTHCHNLMLIDQIINNTLTQEEPITPQQADTMLKLAKLREMLD